MDELVCTTYEIGLIQLFIINAIVNLLLNCLVVWMQWRIQGGGFQWLEPPGMGHLIFVCDKDMQMIKKIL